MKAIYLIRTAALVLAMVGPLLAQSARTADEENTISIFKKAQKAIVHINVSMQETRELETRNSGAGLGSGFFIDRDGHILTSYHIVEASNRIEIYLPGGRRTMARLIGTAPSLDLALVKVEITAEDRIEPLELGDSDQLEVGQKVIAVGHPLAFHNSLTVGVLSALNRSFPGVPPELDGSLIQIDAAVNPGNSGGPLLDSSGRVIAITTARIAQAQNMGFAIPIDAAKHVIPDLIKMGHPYRPGLGIDGVEVTLELAALFGLPVSTGFLIEDVFPGSIGFAIGLRAGERVIVLGGAAYVLGGDIITAIDGKKVSRSAEIAKIFLESHPGRTLRLTIFREGTLQNVDVPLMEMH